MSADLQLLHEYAVTQDADAFSALLRRHQGLVYGTCLRILGNVADAEDAAQECFLKLARHAGAIRTSLAGWLHSCATSVSLNVLQQRQSRTRRENTYGHAKAETAQETTWRDIAPLVDAALERLPDEVRRALIERYLEQRSQTDIAEELSISRGVLRRRLETGIEMIRRNLKQAGVLTSVGLLTGLMAEHAVVAAPAALTFQLGKIAIAGVGLSSTPPAFAMPSASVSSTATLAVLAKKAAIVLATAVLVGGFGIAVAWLCGFGAPGTYRTREESGGSFSAGGALQQEGRGAAATSPRRGGTSSGSRGSVAAGQAAVGSTGKGGPWRSSAHGGRASAQDEGGGADGAALAAQTGQTPSESVEEKKRKREGSDSQAGKPGSRDPAAVRSQHRRPGVLYSIFGPSKPSDGTDPQDKRK